MRALPSGARDRAVLTKCATSTAIRPTKPRSSRRRQPYVGNLAPMPGLFQLIRLRSCRYRHRPRVDDDAMEHAERRPPRNGRRCAPEKCKALPMRAPFVLRRPTGSLRLKRPRSGPRTSSETRKRKPVIPAPNAKYSIGPAKMTIMVASGNALLSMIAATISTSASMITPTNSAPMMAPIKN